jgi:hypothetical protein
VVSNNEVLKPGTYSTWVVTCPAGHPYVLGGGGGFDEIDTSTNGPYITSSEPEIGGYNGPTGPDEESGYEDGWVVFAENPTTITDSLTVWAICSE